MCGVGIDDISETYWSDGYMPDYQPTISPVLRCPVCKKYHFYHRSQIVGECRTYFKDSRPAVANMIEQWGKELFLFYLPVEDTDEFIEKIEQELIRVIIPPCNTQIPYHYTEKTNPLF